MYRFAYREIVRNSKYSTDEIRAYMILKEHERMDFSDECKILGIKYVPKVNFNIPKNVKFLEYLKK